MQNSTSDNVLKADAPEFVPKSTLTKAQSCDINGKYTESYNNSHLSSGSFIDKTMNSRKLIAACSSSKPSTFNELVIKVDSLEEQQRVQQKALDNLTLQMQVSKLGNCANSLKSTNVDQETRIKYLERTFITHWSHSFSSECYVTSKHTTRCEKVITNLKEALPYLSNSSVPSRDQCLASITKWERQYNIENDYLQKLTKHYHEVLNAFQNEDKVLPYVIIQRPSDINDLPDILHDNCILAIKSLNAQNQCSEQGLHMCKHSLTDSCGCQICIKDAHEEQKQIEIPGMLQNRYSNSCNEQMEKSITGNVLASKQSEISVHPQTRDTNISQRKDLMEKLPKNRCMQIPQDDIFTNSPLPLRHKPDVSHLPEEMQQKFQFRRPSFLVKSVYNSKFIGIFKFIKESITDVSDEELLFYLKNVKEKIKSSSAISKESILAAVLQELNMDLSIKSSFSDVKVENGLCVICFYPFGDESKTRLRCHHVYHTTCVTTYFQTDCPLCILSAST